MAIVLDEDASSEKGGVRKTDDAESTRGVVNINFLLSSILSYWQRSVNHIRIFQSYAGHKSEQISQPLSKNPRCKFFRRFLPLFSVFRLLPMMR